VCVCVNFHPLYSFFSGGLFPRNTRGLKRKKKKTNSVQTKWRALPPLCEPPGTLSQNLVPRSGLDALGRFTIAAALCANDIDHLWFNEDQLQVLAEIGVTLYDTVGFLNIAPRARWVIHMRTSTRNCAGRRISGRERCSGRLMRRGGNRLAI